MADTKSEPTTTLPLPASTPGTTATLHYHKSLFSAQPTSPAPRPQLLSIAHAGLNIPTKTLQYKNTMSPKFQAPSLTGAAAMEDNRQQQELEKRMLLPGTSPNPAAKIAMMTQPMSRPADAPRAHPTALPVITSEPPPNEPVRANSVTVASPMEISTPVDRSVSSVTPNPRKRPASPRLEERANKAMTFPPLQSSEPPSPRTRRDMTFPAGSSSQGTARSPQSSKKHKCPHCATEFTRHHNLKSHLLTHSQEKPYGCQQCQSRFRRLHDLKRHIKLHTGEKSHACIKCGRKFARGDALARHNRGPGGCAGRRGSAGDEGEYGDDEEIGQSMDGITYHGDGDREQYGEDESYADGSRRKSEADKTRSDTMNSAVSTNPGTFHHHSSTYPGLAPISRTLYPPTHPSIQSTATSPKDAPKHLSPKPPPSAVQYGNTSPYPQASITDSPKPISPGQPDMHRAGYANPPVSSQLQQPRLPSRINGPEPMFGNLPTQMPQGTSLPSLAAELRISQPYPNRDSVSGQASSHSAINGSSSSHQQSSTSSMREVLGMDGARPTHQPHENVWEVVHSLEMKLKQQEDRHELEISKLKEEVMSLRAQQATAQIQR